MADEVFDSSPLFNLADVVELDLSSAVTTSSVLESNFKVEGPESETSADYKISVYGPIPTVLEGNFEVIDIPETSATARNNSNEIAKLFPCLWGQPWLRVVASQEALESDHKLKIGVLYLGDPKAASENVLRGIYDYLQTRAKEGAIVYAFLDGLFGFWASEYIELDDSYRLFFFDQILGRSDSNYVRSATIETPKQFKRAEDTVTKLDLDALVVIGGDEAITTACLLAENLRSNKVKTRVIGCLNKCDLKVKTIDGDLECNQVLDTECKIYAELIGDMMKDARSTGEYYHFVRVTRRATSDVILECALQAHPNIALIGEEVTVKKLSLMNLRDHIVDVICKRSELGYNYGVILIPDGLFYIIPEVQKLISELIKMRDSGSSSWRGRWSQSSTLKANLSKQSAELFDFLPGEISDLLLSTRKIETDKLLIQLVETELEKRKKEGLYKGDFKAQRLFLPCSSLATDFDFSYCYALGCAAVALIQSGKTGLIASLGNLGAPVEEWTVGGTPLTCLMEVEWRHDDDHDGGTLKPVIKKQAMVELDGAPFKKFASMRDEWALNK